MKKVDLDNLTGNDLVDYTVIAAEFKKYLMKIFSYDEAEADFVVSTDFENPYAAPYIMQDYEGVYTVEGKYYEVRSCHTDFRAVGLFHLAKKPKFKFYILFDLETLPDKTVGSYQNARKMYIL